MTNHKIKVLIVDDSALIRQVLTQIFDADPQIDVIATASDPYYAVKAIQKEVPDVITLDIEMPRMDGLTFLKKIMTQHPIPVVIISSKATNTNETALKALEYGAVEIIGKPAVHQKEFFEEQKVFLCDAIRAAAISRLSRRINVLQKNIRSSQTADAIIKKASSNIPVNLNQKVIVIGASTGGTEAISKIFEELPAETPPIVVVQHMPEKFTTLFAARLNTISKLDVREAKHKDEVNQGTALIAPGNKHVVLKSTSNGYYVETIDGPLVNRHRPSVDVLFRSAAQYAGKNATGIILTGMGNDGAKSMLEMKNAGAYNIAQDERSSVIFGMPKEAIKLNAVDKILSIEEIINFIKDKFKI